MLKDYQTDILAYAVDLSKEIEAATDLVDWLNDQLDLQTWSGKDEAFKAEILITYGGPSVKIELDSRWSQGSVLHSQGVRIKPTEDGGKVEECMEFPLTVNATRKLNDLIGELVLC